ncbi:MAG: M48 family metallopeptidase [Candidatus Uhrbacteria bacterium]
MPQLLLPNQTIEYILKISHRARRMRLAVYRDGTLVVTVPTRWQEKLLEQFILEKSSWILKKQAYFKEVANKQLFQMPVKSFKETKVEARDLVIKKLEYFNQFYQFSFKKISIRNQKTRWGSCSRRGNLNFNYKIALLPEKLADYIIVHELCHLKEFNHSQRFWALVAKTVPDCQSLRKELKANGLNERINLD